MVAAKSKTILLGNEADDRLRRALKRVLKAMDGRITSKMPWVPDTEVMTVDIGGETVTVEADYARGIRLSGPEHLVSKIAERVKREYLPE